MKFFFGGEVDVLVAEDWRKVANPMEERLNKTLGRRDYWAAMRWSLALLLLVVSGCVHYTYSQTTRNVASPKSAACEFEVFSVAPGREYIELGLLDVGGDVTIAPHSVGKFTEMIRESVCRAGGDAVIAQVNGLGAYIHGTVIKYK